MDIHALHFCDVTLIAKKPFNPAYPVHLTSLGDHIRSRRLDLGMRQKDLAVIVNATTSTVTNWEKNRTSPCLSCLPGVFQFLGYNPLLDSGQTFGQWIKQNRRIHGLSIKKLAKKMGIDPTTLARWEKGETLPSEKLRIKLLALFEGLVVEFIVGTNKKLSTVSS